MACNNPRPTETLFGTSTSTTVSVSTSTSVELSTTTRTTTSFSTSCSVTATGTASGDNGECESFVTLTFTSTIEETTTIPHEFTTTVDVEIPITFPTLTRFAPCDDEDDPPPDTSTSSQEPPTVTITSTRTYTDSNGQTRTSEEEVITTSSTLSPDENRSSGKSSAPLIGGIVGGVVGLVALIALIWYIMWRRKRYDDLFDDDEDLPPVNNEGKRGTIKKRFNLDDETTPYAYGAVGAASNPTPYHSQQSSAAFNHGRSSSHTPLMASPPESPPIHMTALPGHHTRSTSMASTPQSYYPGQRPHSGYESLHAPSVANGVSPISRPSTGGSGQALLGVAPVPMNIPHQHYPPQPPPGHAGFYQQYGSESPYEAMHKPPLDPTYIAANHQRQPSAPPMAGGSRQQPSLIDAPMEPPGRAVSTTGSSSVTAPTPAPASATDEKRRLAVVGSPPTSPVTPTVHTDAGRVPEGYETSAAGPPPAYTQ